MSEERRIEPWDCEAYGHDWIDTVECDDCGDDRCGVICGGCDTINWMCDE